MLMAAGRLPSIALPDRSSSIRLQLVSSGLPSSWPVRLLLAKDRRLILSGMARMLRSASSALLSALKELRS